MELPRYDSYPNWKDAKKNSAAIGRYSKIVRQLESSKDDQYNLILKRHLAWLNSATATLLESESAQNICHYWSNSADQILQTAWEMSGCGNVNLALFALGKLGARELNLSSDIDIFAVSESPASTNELSCFKAFIKILNHHSENGFCFRVDTDLRPGGRLGPLISSLSQIQDYYWNHGVTWEKVALIRLRYVCGRDSIQKEVSSIVNQFTFRKYLDFTLFNDLKSIRGKLHSTVPPTQDKFHLKLAEGGIRDIELFINSLQVIHGGRNRELQIQSTTEAASRLMETKAIPAEDIQFLISTYWKLRDLENLVQATDDQQTHVWRNVQLDVRPSLPTVDEVKLICKKVSEITGSLFSYDDHREALSSNLIEQKSWLNTLGFNENSIEKVWPNLIKQTAISSKSERDEVARLKFLRQFVEELSTRGSGKDLGLGLLYDFVKSTRAKASFFSTFLRDQTLISDIARLFSASPYLGGILASRPELVDSFVYRRRGQRSDELDVLLEELTEQKLLSTIFSANDFLRTKDLPQLTSALSTTADDIASCILDRLNKEFDSKVEILALGKWGGRELGLQSDLDLVFLCPNPPKERDFKVSKRFISRLTENHRGGSLYNIDTRLRPSGNAGPIILEDQQLAEHLKNCNPWERQSYLKSRFISGRDSKFLIEQYINQGLSLEEQDELREIERKLVEQNSSSNSLNLKYSYGGIVQTELKLQKIYLIAKKVPPTPSTFSYFEDEQLYELCSSDWLLSLYNNYVFLRTVSQLHQLKSNHTGSKIEQNSNVLERVADSLNTTSNKLYIDLESTLESSHQILKNLDHNSTRK